MSTQPEAIRPSVDEPAAATVLVANLPGTTTRIDLPSSGFLWVRYEYQTEPVDAHISRPGGHITKLLPGSAVYEVTANDALVYTQPVDQSIKLSWAYVQ